MNSTSSTTTVPLGKDEARIITAQALYWAERNLQSLCDLANDVYVGEEQPKWFEPVDMP